MTVSPLKCCATVVTVERSSARGEEEPVGVDAADWSDAPEVCSVAASVDVRDWPVELGVSEAVEVTGGCTGVEV